MAVNEVTEKVLFQLSIHSNEQRPLIVGIDGLSGAGKTTLTKKIAKELINNNCKVVSFHLDDHIVERNKRYLTGHEEWYEYYYLQWNVKELKGDLFKSLHNCSNPITLQFYDKYKDSISTKHITVAPDSIILIEGIFLQRQEWRRFYDFVVFLDCPCELRHERVLNRDMYIGNYLERLNKYQRRYWLGETHYLDTVKPIKNADVVYNVK
ncbi:kinase [Sporosarcina sp. FA9]|uniref:kinase n=1 Tax=Sporosarcina sp. FA9 TaxID=3413030 RepID=UPI003F65E731